MQNWQKNRTYRKYKNEDGTFTYIIMVDGVKVEVDEEIYKEYAKFERQMEYIELDLKRDRVLQDSDGKVVLDENGLPVILSEREISLEKLMDEDWDFQSSESLPEEAVIEAFEFEMLYACLDLLDEDERELINALFFEHLTERQYAEKLGLSKTALHARKVKALKNLKILMEQ